MCNGEFYEKTPKEDFHFFDTLAENTRNWEMGPISSSDLRENPQTKGMYQLSESDDLNATIAALTRKIESLETKKSHFVNEVEAQCAVCETSNHKTDDCPTLTAFEEVLYGQTNNTHNYEGRQYSSQNHSGNHFLGGHNPNFNTYHPNNHNHPNFSWKNDFITHSKPPFPSHPQQFQPN